MSVEFWSVCDVTTTRPQTLSARKPQRRDRESGVPCHLPPKSRKPPSHTAGLRQSMVVLRLAVDHIHTAAVPHFSREESLCFMNHSSLHSLSFQYQLSFISCHLKSISFHCPGSLGVPIKGRLLSGRRHPTF